MKKRKYKKFGAVILIVVMIVTMFSTVSASADEGGTAEGVSSTNSAIYEHIGYYFRSPHRYRHYDSNGSYSDEFAPVMYALKTDSNASDAVVAVYCCDLITSAVEGTKYVRTNLEDALYESSLEDSGYNAVHG